MIVGCKDIDFTELKRACRSISALRDLALDLVPTPLRHIPAVLDNQKYLIALQVRSVQSFTWQKRKSLCEAILEGVRIKGVPDVFYDYDDILQSIDRDAFKRYLEEDRDAEG